MLYSVRAYTPAKGKSPALVTLGSSVKTEEVTLGIRDRRTQQALTMLRMKNPKQLSTLSWWDNIAWVQHPALSWSRLIYTAAAGGAYTPPARQVLFSTLAAALKRGQCTPDWKADAATLVQAAETLRGPGDWKSDLAAALGAKATVRVVRTESADPAQKTCGSTFHLALQEGKKRPVHVTHCGDWRFQCWSRAGETTLPDEATVPPPLPPPGQPVPKKPPEGPPAAPEPASPPATASPAAAPPTIAQGPMTAALLVQWTHLACKDGCSPWSLSVFENGLAELTKPGSDKNPVRYAQFLSPAQLRNIQEAFDRAAYTQKQPRYTAESAAGSKISTAYRLADGSYKQVSYDETSSSPDVGTLRNLESQLLGSAKMVSYLYDTVEGLSACTARAVLHTEECVSGHCNAQVWVDTAGTSWYRQQDGAATPTPWDTDTLSATPIQRLNRSFADLFSAGASGPATTTGGPSTGPTSLSLCSQGHWSTTQEATPQGVAKTLLEALPANEKKAGDAK